MVPLLVVVSISSSTNTSSIDQFGCYQSYQVCYEDYFATAHLVIFITHTVSFMFLKVQGFYGALLFGISYPSYEESKILNSN